MHYGVPGMKWGVRKKDYSSTSVRAAMARRQNDKVDAVLRIGMIILKRKKTLSILVNQ